MELRRELFFAIGVLLTLNVMLAFVSIGLFARMGPAIEGILHSKSSMIAATEGILVTLTEASVVPVAPQRQQRVIEAIGAARGKASGPKEKALLALMDANIQAAFAGDKQAILLEVKSTRQLIQMHRRQMQNMDRTAQQLGTAGAWAVVFVGFLSFVLSIVAIKRLRRRVLAPMLELVDVLALVRQGDRYRRCQRRESPAEIAQIFRHINTLLDEKQTWHADADGHQSPLDKMNA